MEEPSKTKLDLTGASLPSFKIPYEGTWEINTGDVALIFEGGGMRCAFSAAYVVGLLERELNFPKVYGISAGASQSMNYLSKDVVRSRCSFVDLVKDPRFGGLKTFLQGNGYFNAPYLYEGIIDELEGTNRPMEYDFDAFLKNPADMHIEALDWDSGETVAWTKEDMTNAHQMGLRVRASSTMPFFMPPTTFDGHTYMDGGMGSSWGILLEAALCDGYERVVVVRTQERGYRKKPMDGATKSLFRFLFRKHPIVAERTIERWKYYNEVLEKLETCEKSGQAFVIYPNSMPLSNKDRDFEKLLKVYQDASAQSLGDLDALEKWLEGLR